MPGLFDRFTLKEITLRNRIAASPMCQYQADQEGRITDWHTPHYTALARGGAGLVMVEATAVSPEGRITIGDLGLWNNSHIEGLSAIAQAITKGGAVPGIQLGHAGRKGGCTPPWEGGVPITSSEPQAWQPIAPSALPLIANHPHVPRAMSLKDIHRAQQNFIDAAQRALTAGFQWLELHFAHGFLAQSFLSPHSNHRDDAYGGSLENRARFLVETIAAVRRVWPAHLPLAVRLGVLEFDGKDDANLSESITVLQWLRAEGLDLVDVGIGFSTLAPVPWTPNLLIDTAARVALETGLKATTSWLITDAKDADRAVREKKIDFVMVARRLLDNPHWPRHAALELGLLEQVLPTPYAYWLENWRPKTKPLSTELLWP
ncbi:NADH:flavin oxidoreductase/NADH oxidase [Paracidovorax valerianellae]|uniref:2,4-dienoyl-CoA reductase n=1 Tax=Paracidovorax valerianellae TaxID=187868 RepID=A0A1G7CVI1_9BURK|nr:NADH:flavin oxidoreductase/NADH oxidase [Paracidovorax valerianellae]MDA8446306.1 NADH:flavin oxidoreductase/NADH oxidase [Paracidovorax valerianellae]SDE43454.1 2,4-dienoyl-CoA reductase [Paracidovorax valerianellae]